MARWILENHRRKGAVLPLIAALVVVLLGMLAFAVDYGYLTSAKAELRAAVDAANLAGASGLPFGPAEARKRAKEIAAQNTINGQPLILQDSDIELGTWDSTNRTFVPLATLDESKATAIRVNGQLSKTRGSSIGLIFGPVIGYKTANLNASAIAGYSPAADVVIVQDITSSFSDELADAKTGDQALLDSLYGGGKGSSYVGIVAHTGWGQTLAPLQSIKTGYTNLSKVITDLKHCGNIGMPKCSGTDIAAGLEEGIKVFNDVNYTSKSSSAKVMVLVSDGEPNVDPAGSHAGMTNAQLLTLAQQQSDLAWGQKIHVFVVFFNRENDPAAAAKLESLSRGKGDFVQVVDPKQLPTALADVFHKLPVQLLR